MIASIGAILGIWGIFWFMWDNRATTPFWLMLAGLFLLLTCDAFAHDGGQWETSDPAVKQWYQKLMQPDVPTASCCAESDAYYADTVHVRGGKTFAVVTDDRPDGPLARPHVEIGTEVEIPPNKLKWDRGNPTGHNVLFMSRQNYVYCFVQGTGI